MSNSKLSANALSDEEIEALSIKAGWPENRRDFMLPKDFVKWCDMMRAFVALTSTSHERTSVIEECAKVCEGLRDSGENSDEWTITRRKAFHDCAEAVRALLSATPTERTSDVPLCSGHADAWFCGRNHLPSGFDYCVACCFWEAWNRLKPSTPTIEAAKNALTTVLSLPDWPLVDDLIEAVRAAPTVASSGPNYAPECVKEGCMDTGDNCEPGSGECALAESRVTLPEKMRRCDPLREPGGARRLLQMAADRLDNPSTQRTSEPVAWLWERIGGPDAGKRVARTDYELDHTANPYPTAWKLIGPLFEASTSATALNDADTKRLEWLFEQRDTTAIMWKVRMVEDAFLTDVNRGSWQDAIDIAMKASDRAKA